MTKTNHPDFTPRTLSRSEAIAEGAIFDLAEIEAAHGLPEQLGIKIPLAITYCAYSEPFDYREMLLALKSVLRFALHQGETIFRVPTNTPDLEFIWLKALREVEGGRLVLTIMMLDEGRPNLIALRQ